MDQLNRPPGVRLGSADIAAIFRREILAGERLANEKMPAERKMAEQYGVSRGTIRHALGQLASENLLEIRPGSGAYVIYSNEPRSIQAIEHARPLELMDARFALEPHICRLAVLHSTRRDFADLEALLRRMEQSVNDPTAFSEADSEFHSRLAQSTGNNLLIWIASQISSVRGYDEWTRMRNMTLNRETIQKYNDEHRAIVDAIRRREPERAAGLMKQHLETARLSLTRVAET